MKKQSSLKFFLIIFATLLVTLACWLIIKNQEKNGASKEEKIRPAVASQIGFYPNNQESLNQEVCNLLSSASSPSLNGSLLALVVPHAGYPFSGSIAAKAYVLLLQRKYETVIIIGPAHRAIVKGAAIDNADAYETPLGKVQIDKEISDKLVKSSSLIYYDSQAHAEEHSIEVQLPFLQTVLKEFKIVPIVMGEFSWSYVETLSSVLAKITEEKNILIIASSDLSHYHSYEPAVKMDKIAIKEILKMNSKILYEKIKNGNCEMCGVLPVITVIETAKKLEARRAQLLGYCNSGDATGDKSRVVGYSAIAFLKILNLKSENWLSKGEKQTLLKIARQTLENYLKKGKIPELRVTEENLKRKQGSFVTLMKNGKLRGCIGHIEADKPLYQVVSEMAIAAATGDPRFPPVTSEELKDITIEISVLSPLKKVKNIKEIVVGRDGLVIRKGFYSGLLLPQVPVELGWNREEFLRQVSIKAGLSPDAWKNAELYRFTAQIFSEDKP